MEIAKYYGPPGCGKTTKLLEIMEKEFASGVRPDRLAYLSFTKQARRVAITRACEKFKLEPEDLQHFRTLHAICYRELNMAMGGMVKGGHDLQELGNRLGLQFSVKERHSDDAMLDMPTGGEVGDRLLQIDHVRRHNLQSVDEAWMGRFDDDINLYSVRRFVAEYDAWKQREGLRDFTDLLEQADAPLEVDVVIVDEAQDLSRLQWASLHRLAANAERMYIAGDDDQAIFGWAGADPRGFIDHPGKVLVLEQSYRVPSAVHPIATELSGRLSYRQAKSWHPRAGDTGVVKHAPDISRLIIDPEAEYLMLYRHHYLVRDVEDLVRTQGLPYTRGDRPAPGAEWGSAIIFWERFRKGQELDYRQMKLVLDAVARSTTISEKDRTTMLGYGKKTTFTKDMVNLPVDKPWYDFLTRLRVEDVQYLRTIISKRGAKALTDKPKIKLTTIHASKGDEADHVVLLTEMSNRTRDLFEREPDEERRVFYVGVTRAKESLTLVAGGNNPLFP